MKCDTRDVLWIGWQMLKENPLTLPVLTLAPLAMGITGVNYWLERRFVKRWSERVLVDRVPAFAEAYDDICEEVAA